MQPEDRLDALLTALRQPERGAQRTSITARTPAPSADADLAPLVGAARELTALGTAAPDPAFARQLRERMLARAAARQPDLAPVQNLARPAPVRHRAPLWASMAAAALLVASLGTFTAAAYAGPASPLFGLHRLEQDLRAATAGDTASRARLHIQYAHQWLTALDQAARQHQGGGAFQAALAAMLQENAAAGRDAAQVSDSATRAEVQSALAALQADERAGLHAALAQLGWDDRVAATAALGQLGETIPQVTQLTLTTQDDATLLTVLGSGFQPGARLVINGRPAGQVVAATPTQLVVALSRGEYEQSVTSLGVSNPDGTAAPAPESALADLFAHGRAATMTPGGNKAQQTPGPGDHGHATPTPNGHDNGGGGGRGGTPTPDATHGGGH